MGVCPKGYLTYKWCLSYRVLLTKATCPKQILVLRGICLTKCVLKWYLSRALLLKGLVKQQICTCIEVMNFSDHSSIPWRVAPRFVYIRKQISWIVVVLLMIEFEIGNNLTMKIEIGKIGNQLEINWKWKLKSEIDWRLKLKKEKS